MRCWSEMSTFTLQGLAQKIVLARPADEGSVLYGEETQRRQGGFTQRKLMFLPGRVHHVA